MESELKFKNKEEKKSLSEIVSLNDNGDFLINLLKLKDLKGSPKHLDKYFGMTLNDKGDVNTTLINDSGMFKNIKEDLKENEDGGLIYKLIKKLDNDSYKKYPLVDLGTNGEIEISIFAQKIGVVGVLAVDIANQIEIDDLNNIKKSERYKNKKFPVLGLNIDMLELLQQLPDNSCNVSLFSINEDIIKSKEYKKELMNQLYRIVPEDGIVINVVSIMDYIKEEFTEKWQDVIKEKGGDATNYIFRKIVKPITKNLS
jgi:hypothetical protein